MSNIQHFYISGETCKAKSEDKKGFCTNCQKSGHFKEKYSQNPARGNVIATVTDLKCCPLYNESHKLVINSAGGR